MTNSTFMMDVALQFYARHGLAVFPCREKKPLCKNGLKDATTDEATIRGWWNTWPDAQIGLPTGSRNHLLVADSDGPQGNEWIAKQNWPHTLTVETSPEHFQLYFKQPDGVITKNSAGKIAPQLDIRGDGGYIVGAYSFHHKTKKPYLIVRSISGERSTENPILPWADAPASLLDLVTVKPNGTPPVSDNADAIPQGRRHATLLSLAGSFRARGFSPETVLANLRIANEQQCKPPLPDDELQKMAQYVGAKRPGFPGFRPAETSAAVEIESFSKVAAVPVRWLWHKRVPVGFLTLFVGDPGRGKSLASLDLAARISRGDLFPDGTRAALGDVILLSAEDSAEQVLRPRLDAAGADVLRVHRVKAVKVTLADGAAGQSMFNLNRDLENLEGSLHTIPGAKLLVIDPLSAYLGERIDAHKDADVRRVLSPLSELAERRALAVIAVMHLRKSDTSALLRISGSIGFAAAARVVWGFGKDPDTETLCMVPVKNNLAPLGEAVSYNIEAVGEVPRVVWGSNVSVSADEALSGELRERRERRGRRNEAEEWLGALLADGEEKPFDEILTAAQNSNISLRTLKRAKQGCGVRHVKRGRRWFWVLA